MNSLLLDALKGENHSGRPPIWLMRQAGRYLPSYRALREKYSFLEMVHTPEVAAEVTLLPLKMFPLDAAILFADILVVPEALGVGLHFEEGKGPVIHRPIRTEQDVASLPSIDARSSFATIIETIKLLKKELSVPLIGFAGAPFTVASYMIEGGQSRDLKQTKKWLYSEPKSFHKLLQKITQETIAYLNLQIEAGVEVLQLFDSWAGVLDYTHFETCTLHYLKQIQANLVDPSIPLIFFCKGSSAFAEEIAQVGPTAISFDWNAHLPTLRQKLPKTQVFQGNLDPCVLLAPQEVIQRNANQLLKSMHNDPAYIFNLGHGLMPNIPVDSVKTLVETVCLESALSS